MSVFLRIRLLLALGLFLSQIIIEYVKTVRVMLVAGSLLAIILCVLGITILTLPQPEPAFPLTSVTFTHPATISRDFTVEQHDLQLKHYISLTNVQNTHRDLLLNMSFLYLAQNDHQKAQEYWLAAKELDPNNPLFLHQAGPTLQ